MAVFISMQNATFSFSTFFFFALALWPFFMDEIQLSHSYRTTTRRQFTFLNLDTQIRCSQNQYTDLKSALDDHTNKMDSEYLENYV